MMRPPRLWITETAETTMTEAAARAHPDETGGIMVGVLTNGHPWVIVAVEISTPERGRTHYRIPADATRTAVLRVRERDDRLGYLGDWHSHPRNVGPSSIDPPPSRASPSPHRECRTRPRSWSAEPEMATTWTPGASSPIGRAHAGLS